jgi:hypothetical protein
VLDTITQVPAQILFRSDNADVAVLRISPELAQGRAVLPLRTQSPLVEAGERLIAIGYPLNQEQTMTSGIVSSIREGAIISDVNINHGNSGGPLLNMAGEVVGVNTFGDFTSQGGPGISGAIVISRAFPALDSARKAMTDFPTPGNALLPGIPRGRFRLESLKTVADTADLLRYEPLWDISVGKFTVALGTPLINLVRQKAYENDVGRDRKTREARAGMSEEERYSELREYRDWMEYVGDQRAPVVTITVEPKLGETGGSVFRRLMIGLNTRQTIRYKGDLRAAEIYRNGDLQVPILGGTTPVKQYIDNVWVDLKDVANYGVYVFPIELFRPDEQGVPPVIHVKFEDLKNPDLPSCTTLKREIVALVWNDFAPYFTDQGLPFVAANPGARNRMNIPKPSGC